LSLCVDNANSQELDIGYKNYTHCKVIIQSNKIKYYPLQSIDLVSWIQKISELLSGEKKRKN